MSKALRILLIDDDADDRVLITRQLNRGFPELRVRPVSDKEGLTRALEAGDFDLLITDYRWGWGNGLEVIKAVKDRWADRPVVLVTDDANEEVALQLMKAGLDDYVLKSHATRLPIVVKTALQRAEVSHNARALDARYRQVIDNLPMGFCRTSIEEDVIEINPAAMRLFGFSSREAVMAQRLTEFYVDAAEHELLLHQLMDKKQVTGWRVQMYRADGSTFLAEIHATLVRGQDEKPHTIEFIIQDVTERAQTEETLPKARKPEAMDLLTCGILHDFNNILMIISGNLALAKTSTQPGTPLHRSLTEAEKAAQRAKELSRQLFTFIKGGTLMKHPAAIGQLIQDTAELALSGSRAQCFPSIPDDLWWVEVDQGQMSQVIYNLVFNANQAMPDGGVIAVRAENITAGLSQDTLDPGRYVRITIEDQGIGIPEANLPKVFDTYFTTKQEGSGLGLAIAHCIIKNHGGRITVESELGVGTKFTVYLPAANREALPQRAGMFPPQRLARSLAAVL
jgi:PAS domain S-box-containing protein